MSKTKSESTSNKKVKTIVKLRFPIEFGEEGFVEEIALSRPKGKHIKNLGKDPSMDDIFIIASKISGYPPSFFDELDASDCLSISEVIGDFLDSGQEIGKTA